jgi:hypothetical protein
MYTYVLYCNSNCYLCRSVTAGRCEKPDCRQSFGHATRPAAFFAPLSWSGAAAIRYVPLHSAQSGKRKKKDGDMKEVQDAPQSIDPLDRFGSPSALLCVAPRKPSNDRP